MTTDEPSSLIAYAAVKAFIKEHWPGKGTPRQFEMACPVCTTGNLVVSVASNGHTWGKCQGADCKVKWME